MKNRWPVCVPLILMTVFVQGCSLSRLESMVGVSTVTTGEISAPWGTDADHWFTPDSCLSGDRASFRGVELSSPTLILCVVAEPLEGLSVAFIDPPTGERHAIFRHSSCPSLRGDVQRTAWRINGIADVSGFVEMECLSPTGSVITGRIVFKNCH
jgi:hypothetical protein